ncbi:MAG: hypothetical protein AAF741_19440 [Bacteroidota bacterium]
MPVPTKIELLAIIREGRLDLALKKLNQATDEYAEVHGLDSIKQGYTELVLIGGRLQELIHMLNQEAITDKDANVERSKIKRKFISSFETLPEYFWKNEGPPKKAPPKPPPIPVSRPKIVDNDPNQPAINEYNSGASTSSYEPPTHLPEQVRSILKKYRPLIYVAELDFTPLDFERSTQFLMTHLPQVPPESVIAAFTEKYLWQLSGIVLTNRYIFIKNTFSVQPIWFDYNMVQLIELQPIFPWSLYINRNVYYPLGGLSAEHRLHLRAFVEEMVMALRGV